MGSKDFTSECRRCSLAECRTQVVFGVGSLKANLVLIGEAPDSNEDLEGKPFVGRSGEIVDQMLDAINYDRKKVFITNLCLCRPVNDKGGNRTPTKKEVKACRKRLIKTLHRIGRYGILYGLAASEAVLKVKWPQWGRPVYCEEVGKWFTPVKHPSWYLCGKKKYIPFAITEFIEAIKKMRKLYKLGET